MKSIPSIRLLILLAIGVLVAVVGVGCRVLSLQSPEAREAIQAEVELQNRASAYAHYAAGVVQEMAGNAPGAATEFWLAVRANPTDDHLLFDVSGRLIESQQYARALEVLKIAADRPEADGMVFIRLGFVYTRLGQSRNAVAAHREAVERLPAFLPARQNLYLSLVAANNTDEAWAVLAEAAGDDRVEDASYLINLAELFSDFGRRFPERRDAARDAAVELLNLARPLARGPLALKLADGFALLGQTDSAAEVYLEFLSREPNSPLRDLLRAKLTDIYLRQSDRKRAIEQLEALVRDNPQNAVAHYFLGAIAFEERRWSDAVESYARTVALQPGFEQAQIDLVTAQLAAGKLADAEAGLSRLRESKGADFLIEYLTGMLRQEEKEFVVAAQHFVAAEQLALTQETNRLTTGFYFQLGVVHERAHEFAAAAKYFGKSIAIAPENAEALNYLGYMWAERGENLERARELIERALKLEPQNEAYLDSMGWVQYQMGNAAEALGYLLDAVKHAEKPDATILDHLGDVYAALKELDKAQAAWAKSLAIEPNPTIQDKLEKSRSGSKP